MKAAEQKHQGTQEQVLWLVYIYVHLHFFVSLNVLICAFLTVILVISCVI